MQTRLFCMPVVFGVTKTIVIFKQYSDKMFSIKHSIVEIYLLIGCRQISKSCLFRSHWPTNRIVYSKNNVTRYYQLILNAIIRKKKYSLMKLILHVFLLKIIWRCLLHSREISICNLYKKIIYFLLANGLFCSYLCSNFF